MSLRSATSTVLWFAPAPLIAVALFSALAASCSSTPRVSAPSVADERAIVLLTAKGVLETNRACAAKGESMRAAASGDVSKLEAAKALVDRCSSIAHAIADVLEGAEASIDAREELADSRAKCALKKGLDAFDAFERAGVALPKIVDDAKAAARPIVALAAGSCS